MRIQELRPLLKRLELSDPLAICLSYDPGHVRSYKCDELLCLGHLYPFAWGTERGSRLRPPKQRWQLGGELCHQITRSPLELQVPIFCSIHCRISRTLMYFSPESASREKRQQRVGHVTFVKISIKSGLALYGRAGLEHKYSLELQSEITMCLERLIVY